MKTNSISKKLTLSKVTVSSLDNLQMKNIEGGIATTECIDYTSRIHYCLSCVCQETWICV